MTTRTAASVLMEQLEDDHQRQVMEHKIMVLHFEQCKQKAIAEAESKLVTAADFEEIADILMPYVSTTVLLDFYDQFCEHNEVYNSPLNKALKEEN